MAGCWSPWRAWRERRSKSGISARSARQRPPAAVLGCAIGCSVRREGDEGDPGDGHGFFGSRGLGGSVDRIREGTMETKLGQHSKNGEHGKTPRRILVTGGLGFIGSNYTAHCLARGWEAVAYDNFSRAGREKNAAWLEPQGNGGLTIVRDDVRNLKALCGAMNGVDGVAHLAGRVAVTTSAVDPMQDFLVNALR